MNLFWYAADRLIPNQDKKYGLQQLFNHYGGTAQGMQE